MLTQLAVVSRCQRGGLIPDSQNPFSCLYLSGVCLHRAGSILPPTKKCDRVTNRFLFFNLSFTHRYLAMNVDFIKSKIRLLRGANSTEQETLIKNIGICAGVMRTGEYLTPQRRHAVLRWLQENAVRLQLPDLPLELLAEK